MVAIPAPPRAIGSSGKVASSVENRLKSWQAWRDSNPVGPLIPRNLLILRNGRNAKNAQNASLRYTAGTRNPIGMGLLAFVTSEEESGFQVAGHQGIDRSTVRRQGGPIRRLIVAAVFTIYLQGVPTHLSCM